MKGISCFKYPWHHSRHPVLLGAKDTLRLFLEKPAPSRGIKQLPLQLRKNGGGRVINLFLKCPRDTHPKLRTRNLPQVFTGVREEQIQSHALSTHQILRPIPTANKGLWSKQAPSWYLSAPCSKRDQEQITKTSLIQKRNYQTFQTPKRTKGPLFCHIQMKPQMARGTNSNDYSFAFLSFLFFFSFFFFYRALHWSVQKKIKLSTINLSNDNLRVRAAPAWERTSVNRGSHGLMPSLACACIHAGHWLLQTGKRETNQQNLGSLKFHLVHWLEALQFNTVEVQGPSHVLHPKKGCSTHSNRIPWYALMDWLQNALDCSRERDCQQAVLQSSF